MINLILAHFCFSSNSVFRFLKTRATVKTIAAVVAIAMMRTTATTPPMMATVLSEAELDGTVGGGVGILSPSDAGAVQMMSPLSVVIQKTCTTCLGYLTSLPVLKC